MSKLKILAAQDVAVYLCYNSVEKTENLKNRALGRPLCIAATMADQTSDYGKKPYFEFVSEGFFAEAGDVGSGESMSINLVITS